uniref:transposase n=1 Tax=Streptomyces polyasparticus TaxID=2767826 RepID=UPI001BE4CFCC|nr:transposase [Streptomyces polyasparticus]
MSILQFTEGLSDRQAAAAVRARINWKFLLGLELTDAGFDHSLLSEFRDRNINSTDPQRLLDLLLDQMREAGLLKRPGRQRTDSTHVLAAVRRLNRLELTAEHLRAALNVLAAVAPERLADLAPRTGSTATDGGSRTIVCHVQSRNARPTSSRAGRTASSCSTRSMLPAPRPGCANCRRSKHCKPAGTSSTSSKAGGCGRARPRRCRPHISASSRLTTLTPATTSSAAVTGAGTRSI